MKTGTEALSARFVGVDLPPSLIVPQGDAWPQPRSDVIKHPEVMHLGMRRGVDADRRLAEIVAEARTRNVPQVTILLIAEGVNVVRQASRIIDRLNAYADIVEVVLFARGQVAAVPSWLAQRIQSWREEKFTSIDFDLDKLPASSSYRYDEIVTAWTGPTHTLTVIPHLDKDRTGDALLDRFVTWMKIPTVPATTSARVNSSLGREALVALGEFKRRLAWMRSNRLTNTVAAFLFNRARRRFRSEPGERWVLTAPQKRAIAASYAESNRALKKWLGGKARRTEWVAWFSEVEKFAPKSR
ncbi:MAG: hypothetical protein RLZZ319_196 [Actinomycetota bacterium]